MPDFTVNPAYLPIADQAKARDGLAEGLATDDRFQTVLGVTGSGKTATMAWVIAAPGPEPERSSCSRSKTFFSPSLRKIFFAYPFRGLNEFFVPTKATSARPRKLGRECRPQTVRVRLAGRFLRPRPVPQNLVRAAPGTCGFG